MAERTLLCGISYLFMLERIAFMPSNEGDGPKLRGLDENEREPDIMGSRKERVPIIMLSGPRIVISAPPI